MTTVEFRTRVRLSVFGKFLPRDLAKIVCGYFGHDIRPRHAAEVSDQVQLTLGIQGLVEVFLAPGCRLVKFVSKYNYGDIRLDLPGAAKLVKLSRMPGCDINLTCLNALTDLCLQSLGPRDGSILGGLENIMNIKRLTLREIWGPGITLERKLPRLRILNCEFIYDSVKVLCSASDLVRLDINGVDNGELVLMGINPGLECLVTRNVRGGHDFSNLPGALKSISLSTLCGAFDLRGLELPDDIEVLMVQGDGHRIATVEWMGPVVDGERKPGRYCYDMIDRKVL